MNDLALRRFLEFDRDLQLAHGRNAEVRTRSNACRPAGGDRFLSGIKAHTLVPMHVMIPEEGALPATEAVEGHGHRNRHVDPDHADIDLMGEASSSIAITGEDRGAVAIFVVVDQF